MKTTESFLKRSEWDFECIEKENELFCFLYEYARSCPTFIKTVNKFRSHSNLNRVIEIEKLRKSYLIYGEIDEKEFFNRKREIYKKQ